MTDNQLSQILHTAKQADDRHLAALCSIALGLAKVSEYEGDVRLQSEADIRCYGSAAAAVSYHVGQNRSAVGYS